MKVEKKGIFNDQETRSILTMLNSDDRESHMLALEILAGSKELKKEYKMKLSVALRQCGLRAMRNTEDDYEIIEKNLKIVDKRYRLVKFESDIKRKERNTGVHNYKKKR